MCELICIKENMRKPARIDVLTVDKADQFEEGMAKTTLSINFERTTSSCN